MPNTCDVFAIRIEAESTKWEGTGEADLERIAWAGGIAKLISRILMNKAKFGEQQKPYSAKVVSTERGQKAIVQYKIISSQ